jgi:hypothetical protein
LFSLYFDECSFNLDLHPADGILASNCSPKVPLWSPAMPNAFRADQLRSPERLDEVARLLALGYLRLRARRQAEKANDPNHLREFGLDFCGEGSVSDTDTHADRERR